MKDVAVFLYDLTGHMAEPWLEAGFTCYIVDIQHKRGYHPDPKNPRLIRVGADLRSGWLPPPEIVGRVAFAAAFPPCDHLAVSGARWFKGKGLRMLALSIDLFATAAELLEWFGCPYLIENPASTISTYWRKPDYTFHPHHFTLIEPADNYTKLTCLWTGGVRHARNTTGRNARRSGRSDPQVPTRSGARQHPQRHAERILAGRVPGEPSTAAGKRQPPRPGGADRMTFALLVLAANLLTFLIHRGTERAALDAALLRGEVLIA